MFLRNYLIGFLSLMMMLPGILLCFAPAKHHLRRPWRHILLRISALSVLLSAFLSFIAIYFSIDSSFLYLPGLALLFLCYHKSLTLHISQSTAIFMLVCAFVTFLANFSIMFDAFLHPDNILFDYSPQALAFFITLCILWCSVFSVVTSRYASYLFDNLQQPRVWWISTLVSAVFYVFNLCMVVRRYSTLHTNKVGIVYATVMFTMFALLILLCVIFYFLVNTLVKTAETEDRNHILEMQEKQYVALQTYLDSDRKARHDFRQAIYTLKELSSEKDYQAIDDYLSRYIDFLPQKDITDYCKNPALNALLNHYAGIAGRFGIQTDFQLCLPEELFIDNVDLCSIIGNILENAVTACRDIPVEKRFIHFVLSMEQGNEIYIAISNSFSGKLRKIKDRYLSTHKGGNGIGLLSIAAAAERYGGMADFSNQGEVFYSDIMLVNQKKS